jgi:septum formation protein
MDIPYEIVSIDFDEKTAGIQDARLLAEMKSKAYGNTLKPGEILLTADTSVIVDGIVLGKPADEQQAAEMLQLLSGRTHRVETGVCLRNARKTTSFKESTLIQFAELSRRQIEYYISKYKPFDKAGAYGIQEWIGLTGITGIQGDFYNVMGLPAHRVWIKLKEFSEY